MNSTKIDNPKRRESLQNVAEMEVEYNWLKRELKTAVSTIDSEKAVNNELSGLLTTMENQLINFKEGKFKDGSNLVSNTIAAKKVHITKAISSLQEEIGSLNMKNEDMRNTNIKLEKVVSDLQQKLADLSIEVTHFSNALQSEQIASKLKYCNYEDEIAIYFKHLSSASNAIGRLCGNSNQYIAYHKRVLQNVNGKSMGISKLSPLFETSDFPYIPYKCHIIGIKLLYRTLNNVYKRRMYTVWKRWAIFSRSVALHDTYSTRAAADYQMLLKQGLEEQSIQHASALERMKTYYEDIIQSQSKAANRLCLSRDAAVTQSYIHHGDNDLSLRPHVIRSKQACRSKFMLKWNVLMYKQYFKKFHILDAAHKELQSKYEQLQADQHDLVHKYDEQHADWYRSLKLKQLKKVMILCSSVQSRTRMQYGLYIWKSQVMKQILTNSMNALSTKVEELRLKNDMLSQEHVSLTKEVHDYGIVWPRLHVKYEVLLV